MHFNMIELSFSMILIFLFLIIETNSIPVSKQSGPNYLYDYGYLSTDTGSDGENFIIELDTYMQIVFVI